MLKELHLEHVGPAPKFDVEFGKRLNLFTGDNGLGKSFLLDVAWWALTRTWVDNIPILPQRARGVGGMPTITYRLLGGRGAVESRFYFETQRWSEIEGRFPGDAGLVIYMRVDGGFSVWDLSRLAAASTELAQPRSSTAYHFTRDTLWNGLKENGRVLSNGLIADWVKWQYQPAQDETAPFQLLSRVIQQLSPHPEEWMVPGKPRRVSIDDVRDIPTVDLPYGNVPITQVSAGMRRILNLAYLLIWTWYEHTQACELLGRKPTNKLVLLVDEVEAHLHPRWQRSLLPAVLELGKHLQSRIETQVIATTHSPLVLASVEPNFDEAQDRLLLFDLQNGNVTLAPVLWAKQGDVIGWLTSDIFGLKQARSREAEMAIEAAEALMRGEDMTDYPPHLRTKKQIDKALRTLLPGHDPFWPQWIVETDSGTMNESSASVRRGTAFTWRVKSP
jgi:hypothetical protein